MPTIYLYSEIEPGDAARIVAELAAPGDVEVRINSPGGSVADGFAIYNALKARKPVIYVDGIAASIASLIAMAGSRIIMAENALLMIHWPWTVAEGNAAAMRKTADTLDQFGNAMLGAYARTGLDVDTLSSMLDAETWLNSDEAIRLGFADERTPALAIAARFDLSKFRHVPKEHIMNMHTPAFAAAAPAPAPSRPGADPSTAPNVPASPDTNGPEVPKIAEVLLAASAQRVNQGADQSLAAPWLASLTLITEPRLADGAFYLVADSSQIDTYELASLEGNTGPTVEENDEFTSAAHGYRVTHDIGGRFLDWRGVVKVALS